MGHLGPPCKGRYYYYIVGDWKNMIILQTEAYVLGVGKSKTNTTSRFQKSEKITVCWRQSSVGGNDFLHGHPGAGKIDGELKLDSTDDHGEILMK